MNLQQFSPYKILQLYDEIVKYRDRHMELFERYPIHVKIDLTESCNHQCSFCFYGDDNRDEGIIRENISKGHKAIPFNILKSTLLDLAAGGTEAVTLIGGGEPLLHPRIKEIISTIVETGMQFGVVTNGGRPMDDELYALLLNATWIRFSLDAVNPKTYLKLHRPKNQEVDNLAHTLKNLKTVLKRRTNSTMVGASFLLTPSNYSEIVPFALKMKAMGLDYIEYKPMYLDSLGESQKDFFRELLPVLNEVKRINSDNFKVIVLMDRMSDDTFVSKDFTRCWVHYITTHIGADGRVYSCCVLAYAAETEYGSLHEKTFSEIWKGDIRRKKIESLVAEKCPRCWADKTNEVIEHILFELPHAHFL